MNDHGKLLDNLVTFARAKITCDESKNSRYVLDNGSRVEIVFDKLVKKSRFKNS